MILATSSSRAAAQVRRASGKTVAPFRSAKAPLRVQQRLESRRYAAAAEVETDSKPVEEEFADVDDEFNPSTQQVQDLLEVLGTTEIAELDLKIGGFTLAVKRNLKSSAAPAYAPAPVMAAPAPVVMPSPAPSAPSTIEEDDEEDESKLFVSAPKVGIFRRGRYAAGKRVGKGLCANSGDQVKKGQVLGFIEQLGTFIAVEAPQAGEIGKFHVEDGAPVEYLQTIVELAPFFGGHIIGDKKWLV